MIYKFNIGDKVNYLDKVCIIMGRYKGFLYNTYTCKEDIIFGNYYNDIPEEQLKLIKKEAVKRMTNEEKELRKDIEILLNIYLANRKMNRKEIKRFSDRYFDIIEKQNAKNTLKRRGE